MYTAQLRICRKCAGVNLYIPNILWTAADSIGMRVYIIYSCRLTRGPGYPYAAIRWMKIYRRASESFPVGQFPRATFSLYPYHTNTTSMHVRKDAGNQLDEECVPWTHSIRMFLGPVIVYEKINTQNCICRSIWFPIQVTKKSKLKIGS